MARGKKRKKPRACTHAKQPLKKAALEQTCCYFFDEIYGFPVNLPKNSSTLGKQQIRKMAIEYDLNQNGELNYNHDRKTSIVIW